MPGREVARHVTAVLPGVASKNIMSDMQASCWMQTLGSREFPQHALQAIHENALCVESWRSDVENSCDGTLRTSAVRPWASVACASWASAVRIVGVRRATILSTAHVRGPPGHDHLWAAHTGMRA